MSDERTRCDGVRRGDGGRRPRRPGLRDPLKQLKPDISVCVIEKSSTIGAHMLSGAVIEPPRSTSCCRAGATIRRRSACRHTDAFYLLGKDQRRKLPTPPQQNNHGNFIVSLGAMCAWLAPQAEALGVEIYPGFAAAEPLFDDDGAVTGVRIGDMGVARDGSHKADLHPGHRHPRQGDRAGRGRARAPDQAAHQALQAGRRQRPPGLLDRHQGAVAGAPGNRA
jgi:hypothetical protein